MTPTLSYPIPSHADPTARTQASADEHDIATFLAEYAAWLLGCGATCIRIQKNTARIAKAFGVDSDLWIMPSHIHMSVWRSSPDNAAVASRKIVNKGINFNINARLSRLSWRVADENLSLQQARDIFADIRATKPTAAIEILLLTGAANASFCRLFGGDWLAMLIVLVTTLIGYRLKQIMLHDGRDVRLTFLCCAFFSAVLSACGLLFGFSDTPEIALATSVLYLVPGVPYINSVSDMIDRHYLVAMWRFMDALVLTCCLSAGLAMGLLILGIKWF